HACLYICTLGPTNLLLGFNIEMPTIYLSNCAGISGAFRTEAEEGPFEFMCANISAVGGVKVTVSCSGEKIESIAEFQISEALLSNLDGQVLVHDMTASIVAELTALIGVLSFELNRVLFLLKQEMCDERSGGHLVAISPGLEWSKDCRDWYPIRGGELTGGISIRPNYKLDNKWKSDIQDIIDSGEYPLLAMQHLYEARRGSNNRSRWIEAAIAAEIAVKEILVLIEPKYKNLLVELPSPPIRKLYGVILEELTGERSPYVSALEKGAAKRNEIVHKPESGQIETQELIDYLATVEQAIQHLVQLRRSKKAA
ncbi:MAG: hypothetical protein AB8H12_07700, partial [Lewinella sp.]